MPTRFKVYEGAYPYFITSPTLHWIPIFRRDDYFRVLVDSILHCVAERGLLVHAYVLMPDHFHFIVTQPEGRLAQVIGNIKGFTAHLLAEKVREDGRKSWVAAMKNAGESAGSVKVWQDGFHPEQVYSQEFFEQKLRYIHDNPVRAGFVLQPADWKYSSAGFHYEEREPVIPITCLEW